MKQFFLLIILLVGTCFIKTENIASESIFFRKYTKYAQVFMDVCNTGNKPLSEKEKKQCARVRRRVMELLFAMYDKLKQHGNAFDLIDDPEHRKQMVRGVDQWAQYNFELSYFSRDIIKILVKNLILMTDISLKSPYYDRFQSADITFEEMAIMWNEYAIPKDVDIVQACMEYIVWAHGYLYKWLQLKKAFVKIIPCQNSEMMQNLSIDTSCYVIKQLGFYLKLPHRSQKMLDELVGALGKGWKTLPQDMKRQLIVDGELRICDPLTSDIVQFIASTAQKRKNMTQSNTTSSVDLDDDEDDEFWDDFIEMLLSKMTVISEKHQQPKKESISQYAILEKMLFEK